MRRSGLSALEDAVQVQVRFAMYTPELMEDDGRKRRVWRRQPQAPEAFDVPLDAGGEEWDDQVADLQFRERASFGLDLRAPKTSRA